MLYSCKDGIMMELEDLANVKHRAKMLLKRTKDVEGEYLLSVKRAHYRKESTYYIAAHREDGRELRKYLGLRDGKNKREIAAIKERRFLKKCIDVCDSNIETLEKCLDRYIDWQPEDLECMMSRSYKDNSDTISKLYDTQSDKKWLKEMQEVKKSYGPYRPEGLIHRAPDGSMLRSKSEVVIYVTLQLLRIPFVYELPRSINGILFRPDFTFRNAKTGGVVLVEYMGMSNDDDYRENSLQKIHEYYKDGFFLGRNFFIFMDDRSGHIDSESVARVLKAVREG